MFFIRIFRFLTGYIIFTCKNGFPERFLNLCARNGVNVWDARAFDGRLEAKTNISGIKSIRECAEKSGMSLRITEECGLPFIIKPYLKRTGIAAGLAISVVMLALLSSCVWTINVSGNTKYTSEQILELAEHYGVYAGAFRRNIDRKAIREEIKATADGINWFSVNIDGSAVSLELLELTDDRATVDTSPCNIVSGVDGEILKLDVYTGDSAISVGSAVTKGDLLISGVREKADGSAEFVHARGFAVIRTRKKIISAIPKVIEAVRITAVEKHRSIYIYGIKIPLGIHKYSDVFRTENSMVIYGSKALPVGIITNSHLTYQKENLQLTEGQNLLLCAYSAFTQEMKIMHNATTENKKASVTQDEKSVKLTISYINHEKSGIEYPFVVEDSNYFSNNAQ